MLHQHVSVVAKKNQTQTPQGAFLCDKILLYVSKDRGNLTAICH